MEKNSLKLLLHFISSTNGSQVQMDPGLKFYSHVLALSFKGKGKSFNLMVFMLQFESL